MNQSGMTTTSAVVGLNSSRKMSSLTHPTTTTTTIKTSHNSGANDGSHSEDNEYISSSEGILFVNTLTRIGMLVGCQLNITFYVTFEM